MSPFCLLPIVCSENSYNDAVGQGSCTNCLAGFWTNGVTSATSASQCVGIWVNRDFNAFFVQTCSSLLRVSKYHTYVLGAVFFPDVYLNSMCDGLLQLRWRQLPWYGVSQHARAGAFWLGF